MEALTACLRAKSLTVVPGQNPVRMFWRPPGDTILLGVSTQQSTLGPNHVTWYQCFLATLPFGSLLAVPGKAGSFRFNQ